MLVTKKKKEDNLIRCCQWRNSRFQCYHHENEVSFKIILFQEYFFV